MAENKYLKSSEPPAEVQKAEIKPIASGKLRKKGFFRKTKDFLFTGDLHDVKDYIVEETIKPAIRDGIYDAILNFFEGMIYGDSYRRSSRRSKGGSKYEKSSYTNYYKSGNKYEDDRKEKRRREPERLDLDCIFFEDDGPEVPRQDRRTGVQKAQAVVARMTNRISMYTDGGTVQDIYDFCGMSCPDWNATEWGWIDPDQFEKKALIRRVRGGAELSLPSPEPID